MSTSQIIRFVIDPDTFVSEEAQAYVTKNAYCINERIWEISLSKAEYERLESTPGDHHNRRMIAECLHDEKKVAIHLLKDGIEFVGKIEADALRRTENNYYSTWRLDAADRRLFEKKYGRSADINPGDIVKITYGKKTLYEATPFMREASS